MRTCTTHGIAMYVIGDIETGKVDSNRGCGLKLQTYPLM